MATRKKTAPAKKTPPKRSAAGDTKKKSGGSNYKSDYELRRKSRRQVSAILLFTIGILLASVALIPGTNVWLWCHDALYGLFGITVWAIPAALLYIAIMATLDKPIGEIHNKLWQTGILVLLICGLIEICTRQPFAGTDFFSVIGGLFERGKQLEGGGVFAAVVGWPLQAACGKTGAIIIISLFLFAAVMLLTGSTLIGLFRGIAKPVKKINENYAQLREEQENQKKFDIDVDLGPEPPMPEHPVSSPKPTLDDLLEFEKQQTQAQLDILRRKKKQGKREEAPASQPEEAPVPETLPPATEDAAVEPVEHPVDKEVSDLVEQALRSGKEEGKPEPPKIEPVFDKNEQAKLYTDENNTLNQYVYPPVALLKLPKGGSNVDASEELRMNAELLVNTLKSFGVQTKVVDIHRGPTVTRYELQPSAGVKISKITGLADDIALNLAAAGVRIEAPIPNKAAVGIEVPNKKTDVVTLREIVESKEFEEAKSRLTVALGKDIAGNSMVADLGKMPHILIAGSTGSGKSVCINSFITSLLYKASPSEVRLLMIDPKVVELGIYNGIPHLLVPVVTDPRKASGALAWAVTEMLNRYKLFADNSVRDLNGYNALAAGNEELNPLPQIVIIIDELADLMMAAPNEVEDSICRLAQMARAAGMHLVIATQRPSVDVITGIIKANIPSRIAFAVSSQVDSRTILDSSGAEKLLGRGDMLFYPVGVPKPVRVQGCFVSDKEVEQVVDFVKNKESADYDDKILEEIEKQAAAEKGSSSGGDGGGFEESDSLLSDAIECVVEAGQASTSYIQRKLKVGYARAARLIDEMEEKGIIGPFEGSKPRPVLITRQQWIEMNMNHEE